MLKIYVSSYCKVVFCLLEEVSTWSEREAQMRVLLDARGHKIEELQCVLSDLKDSSEREIRIIKHQLLMMTGAPYILCPNKKYTLSFLQPLH